MLHSFHYQDSDHHGGWMLRPLGNERGMTLIEVLVTSLVILFTVVSIYIGVVFAEKQMLRNYRDRVATLAASGEMEWQYYHHRVFNSYDTFSQRQVVIDHLPRGRVLYGNMSVDVTSKYETPMGQYLYYDIVEVAVAWNEPLDRRERRIVIREDFYHKR